MELKVHESKVAGHLLISRERLEQINKHGHDDHYNTVEELLDVAIFCVTLNNEYYPRRWSHKFKYKLLLTSLDKRIIYSGAFMAAAYDKIRNEKEPITPSRIEESQDYLSKL